MIFRSFSNLWLLIALLHIHILKHNTTNINPFSYHIFLGCHSEKCHWAKSHSSSSTYQLKLRQKILFRSFLDLWPRVSSGKNWNKPSNEPFMPFGEMSLGKKSWRSSTYQLKFRRKMTLKVKLFLAWVGELLWFNLKVWENKWNVKRFQVHSPASAKRVQALLRKALLLEGKVRENVLKNKILSLLPSPL